MSTRKILTAGVLPLLMLLLVAGPASAKRATASPTDQSEFLLRTPDSRVQGWQDGLVQFMAEHQNLTTEQAYAIQNLAGIASPTAFAHTLAPSQKDLFAKHLAALNRILPYRAYLGMLRAFDDELRVWLVTNGLATQAEAATDTCTCSSGGGCSSGYTCEDVTCVHEGGTTHNGRCGAAAEQ
jgi:hypothetical protein